MANLKGGTTIGGNLAWHSGNCNNSATNWAALSLDINGIVLEDSSDRTGLLEINRKGATSWTGIQVNYGEQQYWSLMGNSTYFGLYDDTNSKWAWNYNENASLDLYFNGGIKLQTVSNGVSITGDLSISNDLVVNGGDISINNNNGGINFNDVTKYWLKTSTNWGLYWNTTENRLEFHGSGTNRAYVDFDTGLIWSANGIFATSASRIGGNLQVDHPSHNASISLAIGDSDTGFNSAGDGNMQVYANNINIANWQSSGFNFTTHTDVTSITATGNLIVNHQGKTIFGTAVVNNARVDINCSNAGSPQIEFSDGGVSGGDMSWAIGADDGDNSFKIHGTASATMPVINSLALPFFEITTGGQILVQDGSVLLPRYSFGSDTDTGFYRQGSGSVSLSCNNNEGFRFDNGTFHANGNIIGYSTSITSDKRLKKDIIELENSLDIILKSRGVEFKYKKDNSKHLGYIAQEIEELVPDIVVETEMIGYDEKYKVVNYTEIIPHITEAIKEQQNIIEKQNSEISELKSLLKEIILKNK